MSKPNFHARGNKIHFISLGCPRNLVDTEVMLGILLKEGYEPAEELPEADFIIINTCGFLQASRAESLETIEYATSEKKEGAKVIVAGCMVQTHKEEIQKEFPDLHYLLGSGEVEEILRAVTVEEQGEKITTTKSYLEAGEVPRTLSTPGSFAYLKIAEGCRKRCAYCIIPDIKGHLRSKPLERVVQEFHALLGQGVKEVILIAQDLGDWGKDLGYSKSEGLIVLLKELLKTSGDYWIRLLYLYPDEITDELIDLMRENPRICPYLDMPIQHVSNPLLKAMRRKTSKEEIVAIIEKLREQIPGMAIRTSLIVGFPGETEEQFEELCDFVQEYPLDHVGIFTYSKEEGSAAAEMEGQIEESVKEERQEILAALQQEVVEERSEQFIGKKMKVLVEGFHPESELLMRGRHSGQCPDIDGQVIINDGRAVNAFNEWYEVEITDLAGYDLIGRVLRPLAKPKTKRKKSSGLTILH